MGISNSFHHDKFGEKLMNYPEQSTCAHIPCSCVVSPGEKYCSDSCRDAGADEVEIACECGHATCAIAAEEEDVA
jgi:hypothetical protein